MRDVGTPDDETTSVDPVLPSGWTTSIVGEIGDVELGRQRSPDNHTGPFMRPYIRAANVTWLGIDTTDILEMNFDESDFGRFALAPGDVLINEGSGSAAEVGKPTIWRGEIASCCFQNTVLRVRPQACTSEFLHRFFYYCAKTRRFVPSTQGVNIFHIGKAGLAHFPIAVPPLAEQRRIVAKLDRLSARSRAARDHLARTAKLAARAKQAILAEEFGREWPSRHLGDLATVGTGATPKRGNPRYYSNGTIPWVTSGAVNKFDIDGVEQRITEAAIRDTNCKIYPAGTLLVAMYGEGKTRGKVGRLNLAAATNQALAAIQLRSGAPLREGWLIWLLHTRYLELRALASGGVQPNLNLSMIKSIKVPIPPLEHQDRALALFAAAFARLDRLTSEAARAAHLLDQLDERLLAKAFRGELVPQDPADEPAEALLARILKARAAAPARGRRGRAAS